MGEQLREALGQDGYMQQARCPGHEVMKSSGPRAQVRGCRGAQAAEGVGTGSPGWKMAWGCDGTWDGLSKAGLAVRPHMGLSTPGSWPPAPALDGHLANPAFPRTVRWAPGSRAGARKPLRACGPANPTSTQATTLTTSCGVPLDKTPPR